MSHVSCEWILSRMYYMTHKGVTSHMMSNMNKSCHTWAGTMNVSHVTKKDIQMKRYNVRDLVLPLPGRAVGDLFCICVPKKSEFISRKRSVYAAFALGCAASSSAPLGLPLRNNRVLLMSLFFIFTVCLFSLFYSFFFLAFFSTLNPFFFEGRGHLRSARGRVGEFFFWIWILEVEDACNTHGQRCLYTVTTGQSFSSDFILHITHTERMRTWHDLSHQTTYVV
jgi:hypothetical protein